MIESSIAGEWVIWMEIVTVSPRFGECRTSVTGGTHHDVSCFRFFPFVIASILQLLGNRHRLSLAIERYTNRNFLTFSYICLQTK
jgi:hypothetical protein